MDGIVVVVVDIALCFLVSLLILELMMMKVMIIIDNDANNEG